MLCNNNTWGAAQAACYAQGLRPAIVSDNQVLAALTVVQDCLLLGGRRVWIDSFNQLGADPCAYIVVEGAAVYSPGDQLCNELDIPILCQEAPTSLEIVTVPDFVTTISTGTSTVLTTTCIQCNCAGSVIPTTSIRPPSKANPAVEKSPIRRPHHCDSSSSSSSCHHDFPPHCQDPQGCLPLCPFTVGGLHVIQGNVTFNQAARECAKYGWNLADVYAGLHADVGFMQKMCALPSEEFNMWIRSYNGVDGGMCMVTLMDDFYNVPIGFGWSAEYCMDQPLYVLCQDRPPAVTGSGAFIGSASTTVELITVDTTLFTPTTTITVTVTNFF